MRARIGQICVVTLDPIENEIEEEVDLMFAPEAEVRRLADLIEEGQDDKEPPQVSDPRVLVPLQVDGRVHRMVRALGDRARVDPDPPFRIRPQRLAVDPAALADRHFFQRDREPLWRRPRSRGQYEQ